MVRYLPLFRDVLHSLLTAVETNEDIFKYRFMWSQSTSTFIFVLLFTYWLHTHRLLTFEEIVHLFEGKEDVDQFLGGKHGVDQFDSASPSSSSSDSSDSSSSVSLSPLLFSPSSLIILEDYLYGIMMMCNEFPRLSLNAVNQNSLSLPFTISSFFSSLYSVLLTLHLKNDRLRKRFDSVKYDQKRCEEIIYDLKLRKLGPSAAPKDV
jgi:hypothetical protein